MNTTLLLNTNSRIDPSTVRNLDYEGHGKSNRRTEISFGIFR